MNLVVATQYARTCNERRIGHAINGLALALHGIGWAEHAGHDGDLELLCERLDRRGERAFERLRLLIKAPGRRILRRGLRQHD